MSASASPDEKTAILEQLERILASPSFRNSRRYPAFLRHIVERTLEGRATDLKERTVGVEVFGRAAEYDTNADPIVRVTAGEVRNRIARYYHEPGHERELRIELPPGSYVPEFRWAAPAAGKASAGAEPIAPAAETAAARRRLAGRPMAWAVLAGGLLMAVLAWWRPWHRTAAFEQFWEPFLDGDAPVTICLARAPNSDPSSGRPADIGWPDVSAAVSVVSALEKAGARHRLRLGDELTFEDLRRAPSVLIGAFNAIWTLRLTENLRFEPRQEGNRRWVWDRSRPERREWSVELGAGAAAGAGASRRDYAIISRLLPSRTDRPLLMLAGLTGFGTSTAAEFVADPAFLGRLGGSAPSGWQDKNLQVVIETEVIAGHAGPPRVLAVHVW